MTQQIVIPCECGCSAVAVADYEDEYAYLEFYTRPRHDASLRERLRFAWAALRNRDPYMHDLMLRREQLQRLHEFIGGVL